MTAGRSNSEIMEIETKFFSFWWPPVIPPEGGMAYGWYNTPLEWPKIGNICYFDQFNKMMICPPLNFIPGGNTGLQVIFAGKLFLHVIIKRVFYTDLFHHKTQKDKNEGQLGN
jgi:hypothetical protein